MKNSAYKYLYGPVSSWRLGSSLGIDPLSCEKKICSFDCVYCQIGRTDVLTTVRQTYVNVADLIQELNDLPSVMIDYITFAGKGEPTLAANLGDMIRAIKKIRKEKIAVITNATLLATEDVRQDLMPVDVVIAKLDASNALVFNSINRPHKDITFDVLFESIKNFKQIYKGKLALQIMFTAENSHVAEALASCARAINPDEVEINTPLRPCAAAALPPDEIKKIEKYFRGLPVVSVYAAQHKDVIPLSDKDTLIRRGKV